MVVQAPFIYKASLSAYPFIKCSWIQAVIDSMSEDKIEPTSINDMFVIDTKGDEPKVNQEVETDHQPVKKLKRRNAAMYASQD